MALRPRSLGWLWLGGLSLLGCDDEPASCPPWSAHELAEIAALAPPEAPGVSGPLIRDPRTGAVIEAADGPIWLDPSPHQRGDHAMLRVTRGPRCEPIVEPTIGGPALAAARTEPFGPPLPDAGMGAVVITTEATGDGDDWRAWERTLAAVGVSGLSLSGPSADALEAALALRLGAIARGGVFVLVTSGPATLTGRGLVLARANPDSSISFERLTTLLERDATHLGLLVWVVDASFAADARPPTGVPTLLLRGSDRDAASALRVEHGGPSALALAFEAALAEARAARCVGVVTDPGELAALLHEAATQIRPQLSRLRWERIGLPALARATPDAAPVLMAWLERQTPRALLADLGTTLPAEDVCATDRECAARDACLGQCAAHRCDAGRCVPAPTPDLGCDDGDACTDDDRCAGLGECAGTPITCDDGDPCTDNACDRDIGCVATPATGRPCDDGDPCTTDDACDDGRCAGASVACDDGDPCTVDTCTPEDGCQHERRDGLACDDGDPCTLGDRCQAGLCLGVARPCGDDNPCTADRCDPATGACVFLALADYVSCVDEDPCTTASRCIAGRCQGVARTCDDGIACTLDRCGEDGACQHLPEPGTCLSPVAGEGCVPVGQSPHDEPCLTCLATGVFASAADGASCGPGEGCAARRCRAGRCVTGDDPQSCTTPEGGCVAVGEPITDCLTCLGGGVAGPRVGACALPDCGLATCVDGACRCAP